MSESVDESLVVLIVLRILSSWSLETQSLTGVTLYSSVRPVRFVCVTKLAWIRTFIACLSDVSEQKQRTEVLEIKFDALSGASDYSTVRGYCNLNRIKVSERDANSLGRQAAKICRLKGYPIGKVPDERHGKVNSYPIEVLDEVSEPYKNQIRVS